MLKTKHIFVMLTFFATISQGLWLNWIQDEGILIVDIPLILLLIFGRKRLRLPSFATIPLIVIALFYFWIHLGMFYAPNKLLFRKELLENLRVLIIFLVVVHFINSREDLQYILLGFAIGGLFQGLVGVHQWLRGPVGLGFLGEQNVGWQAKGTFIHPSIYGMYITLMTILSYRMAVFVRPKFHKVFLISFFVGIAALYAALNRATWLGFAAAMLLMFFIDMLRGHVKDSRSTKILLVVFIAAFAGGIRYGSVIIGRFDDAEESMTSDRSSSRKSLALDALRIIREHPVGGTGLGNYIEYVDKSTQGTKVVHCTYLLVAAETGWPGGAIFVMLILSFFYVGIKGMLSKNYYFRNVSTALVTANLAFVVAMLPSPDYRNFYIKNHIWMIWALTLAVAKLNYYWEKQVQRKSAVKTLKARRGAPSLPSMQSRLAAPIRRTWHKYPLNSMGAN